jgi:WD repeat-containing protein 68
MKLHGSSMVRIGVSTKTKNMRLVIVPSLKIYCFEVEVVQLGNNGTCEFKSRSPKLSSEYPYPTTKIMFIPDKEC